jgi:hypothetical protein
MILKIHITRIAFITLLFFAHAFPWVKTGHQAIGYIAQMNLSPATIEKLKPLLQEGSLADISTWADTIKKLNHSTKAWHYIGLPIRENISKKDLNRFYSNHGQSDGNIVSQVNKDIAALQSKDGSLRNRQEALKFLVHFIEDAHQPLHCADDDDKRGNDKQVLFFSPDSRSDRGHLTDLHSLWNNMLDVKASKEDPQVLGERLNRQIKPEQKQKWASGSIEDWVFESYSIAKNKIYKDLPAGPMSEYPLPNNYYDEMRPVADEQMEKAGVRLSFILNNIFQ